MKSQNKKGLRPANTIKKDDLQGKHLKLRIRRYTLTYFGFLFVLLMIKLKITISLSYHFANLGEEEFEIKGKFTIYSKA